MVKPDPQLTTKLLLAELPTEELNSKEKLKSKLLSNF